MSAAGILVAAGASRRLGRAKQLVEFEGQPLVRHAALRALAAGCMPLIVVTGAYREEVECALEAIESYCIHNPDWEQGMGRSIVVGIEALMNRWPQASSVLLQLCDQPDIPVEHLRQLIVSVTESDGVAATRYERSDSEGEKADPSGDVSNGVPACFASKYFAELAQLTGDVGARQLLRTIGGVRSVPCPEADRDVDQPDDLPS